MQRWITPLVCLLVLPSSQTQTAWFASKPVTLPSNQPQPGNFIRTGAPSCSGDGPSSTNNSFELPSETGLSLVVLINKSSSAFVAVSVLMSPPSPEAVTAVVLPATLSEAAVSNLSAVAAVVLRTAHWAAVVLVPLRITSFVHCAFEGVLLSFNFACFVHCDASLCWPGCHMHRS
jgi:hypothetical protein